MFVRYVMSITTLGELYNAVAASTQMRPGETRAMIHRFVLQEISDLLSAHLSIGVYQGWDEDNLVFQKDQIEHALSRVTHEIQSNPLWNWLLHQGVPKWVEPIDRIDGLCVFLQPNDQKLPA